MLPDALNEKSLSDVSPSLCRAFPPLKALCVGISGLAPDEVLERISEEPSLKELHLVSSSNLTDARLKKLFMNCRNLQIFLLGCCDLLTINIFKDYVDSSSQATLAVRYCKGIRPEMLPEDLRLTGRVTVR